MKIYIESTENNTDSSLENLFKLGNGRAVYADLKDVGFRIDLGDNKYIYLYGDIFYHIRNDDKVKLIDSESEKYLRKIFLENKFKDIIPCLEGQYIGLYVDASKRILHIFSDRYARLDTFYSSDRTDFYFATDLDFIFKHVRRSIFDNKRSNCEKEFE